MLQAGLGQVVSSTKPRILVCTPSNAACDELMLRIMSDRFCDGNGKAGCLRHLAFWGFNRPYITHGNSEAARVAAGCVVQLCTPR